MVGQFGTAQFEGVSDDESEYVGVCVSALDCIDWLGKPKFSILLQVLFRLGPEFSEGDWICDQLKYVIEIQEQRTPV
jgi:hypothetical protein